MMDDVMIGTKSLSVQLALFISCNKMTWYADYDYIVRTHCMRANPVVPVHGPIVVLLCKSRVKLLGSSIELNTI